MPVCKRCEAPIYWDPERKSESGKWVPIDEETDEPHNCPERDWNSGKGAKGIDPVDAITNLEGKMDELNKNMLKLIFAIHTVQQRIEGQMPLFPSTRDINTKEVSEPILDPTRLTEEK